jgi:hypothetical protein
MFDPDLPAPVPNRSMSQERNNAIAVSLSASGWVVK